MSHVCECAVRTHGRPAPATGVKGYSPLQMG
jgi:hypothetical protein